MNLQNWISAREASKLSLLAQSQSTLSEKDKRSIIQSLTGTAKAIAEAILGIGEHSEDIINSANGFKKWAEDQRKRKNESLS